MSRWAALGMSAWARMRQRSGFEGFARLAHGRIIRQRLLPPAEDWTSVRAVELRCESTWQSHFGRYLFPEESLFGLSGGLRSRGCALEVDSSESDRPGPVRSGSTGYRSLSAGRRVTRPGSVTPRAYSSIGQSPRLITGLFLVRTQVGPLALSQRAHSRGARSPGAFARGTLAREAPATRLRPFQSGEGAWGGARGRRRALADIAMRRPTYL